MAHMLRCLFFLEAKFNFSNTSVHIAGVDNTVADFLSRNNMTLFHSLVPQADLVPVAVQAAVVLGLTFEQPWTSQHWMTWFSNI